jgi:hypothetical protein
MCLSALQIGIITLSIIVYVAHTIYVFRHPYIDLNDPSRKFSRYPYIMDPPTERKDN